jgi:Thioredoxin domain-containing protein
MKRQIVILIFALACTFLSACSMSLAETIPETDVEQQDFPLKITAAHLDEIKAYGVPTVIDFGSDSCIPCKEMAPVLETLNAEMQGKAAVQFMDVWVYDEGLEDFPIQLIPTQVFFNAEGKPFEPSEELASQIPFTIYSYRDTGEIAFTVHQGGITEADMRLILAEMGVEA